MDVQRVRPAPQNLLPQLRRARDHIDRNYQLPLQLDQLAAVAGVSKYHFVRCFAASYAETPIRYLTRRRIERAQDLLRSANLTVTEVCMAVGFTSLGSFSSRFTQLVGKSPTAYRNEWAARGAGHIPGCFLFVCGVLDRPSPLAAQFTPTAPGSTGFGADAVDDGAIDAGVGGDPRTSQTGMSAYLDDRAVRAI